MSPLEVDVEFDLRFDEGTNTSQTQLVMDEDMDDMNDASKLWTTSEQGSETFTNVYEQEESEANSDNREIAPNNSFTLNSESPFCPSHEIDNDQAVSTMVTEAQQLNYIAGDCTAEEGNTQSDLAAGVSTHGLVTEFSIMEDEMELTEEEHVETFNVEYQPQTSPPASSESQSPEEMSSESDEELPEDCSATEQSSQSESVMNNDEPFTTSPNFADKYNIRDDMKEFTEEDQEQIEESLADYPSDLSHSETEEPAENVTAQPFTLIDNSSSDDPSMERMEDLSSSDNVILQNKDSPALDHNSGITDLEVEIISSSADLDLSFQRGNTDEEDVQESLANDRNIEEDIKIKEDPGDLHDGNHQADYISDSSSDDHSTSQEETQFLSSVNQEEENNHGTQHNYLTEDLTRMDDDIEYICPDTGDEDANSPGHLLCSDVEERDFISTSSILYSEEPGTESAELHRRIQSVQSDTGTKDHDKSSSEALDNVEHTKNVITEVLWTSGLMTDEDNLCLDEYDWDLSGEDVFKISSGEGQNQDETEEVLDELYIDQDEELSERDWELEKTRIEAFYRFYGDQDEPEDEVGKHTSVFSNCLSNSNKTVNGLQVSETFLTPFTLFRQEP